MKSVEWGEYRLGDLFEILSYKKRFDANKVNILKRGKFPYVVRMSSNNGQKGFINEDPKNVISIPSNSDVYRAYFQSNEFTVLSDAYAIHWIYNDLELMPSQYLFAVSCINKVTDLPIYSYKNKLGGWNVVKTKYIQLSVKDGEPDYEIMHTLISAIQKLVIKDVVMYVDRKNANTKTILKK